MVNFLDRINRILIFHFQFPDETENTQSAFSGKLLTIQLIQPTSLINSTRYRVNFSLFLPINTKFLKRLSKNP